MMTDEVQPQSKISELLRSSFCAEVEGVFCIPGKEPNSIRGTVLVVKVTAGVCKVGAKIYVSSRKNLELVVGAIERDRVMVQEAFLTERVGLLFLNADLSFVQVGDVINAAQ